MPQNPTPDQHGNVEATEGCSRCYCGAKYWEHDVCVSCGQAWRPEFDADESPMVVTRHPATEWTAEMASVRVTVDGRTYEVEIYGPDVAYGSPRPAQINWSAFGSVPAHHATAYASALTIAAKVAPTLARPNGVPTEVQS